MKHTPLKVSAHADNWFMLYINGKLVAVDPIDFIPHDGVTVDIFPGAGQGL